MSLSELVFVVGPSHHPRLADLAEALAIEVRELGLGATVERRALPARRVGRVPVVLDPGRLRLGRRPRNARRSVADGALLVHAGLDDERDALDAQTAFELDPESFRRRRARGEPVARLAVGWSQAWAAPDDADRDIDIALLGASNDDHFRWLARSADELSRRRVQIEIAVDPLAADRHGGHGLRAAERRAVLARSKLVIDLTPEDGPRLEAVRAAEAICAGAVLVRDAPQALDPLEPDRHYVVDDDPIRAAAALLADEERRRRLQSAASAALEEISLRSAAGALIAAAEGLPAAGPPRAVPLVGRGPLDDAPPPVTTDPAVSAARRRLKRVRLEQIELARELDRLALRLAGGVDEASVEISSPAADAIDPRVSVLVTVFDYENEIEGALDSVAASEFEPLELVIVDDSSRDGSRDRVRSWVESHPDVAARLVVHPANRGLPSARNTALAHARGELVFILDADNRVLPHALGRLAEALDSDPGAALAYGLAARVDDAGRALGLMNLHPWSPERLRVTNYIDAMSMIRADVLRRLDGYATELTLYGWEDYDLWCRMAEAGMRGVYVPEILAIYRSSYSGMAWSVSNISTTDAYRAVIQRAPRLMVGVRPPR